MKKAILIFLILVFLIDIASANSTSAKFRAGPIVNFSVLPDSIEAGQDAIVELSIENPSLNDVTLYVEARVDVPNYFHVYTNNFQASGAGVVVSTLKLIPGTKKTFQMITKVDKSARIGSHNITFVGLYYPEDNSSGYKPINLRLPITTIEKQISRKPSASVQLHGEKTDVVLGEDIILKLSAINVIPNPMMNVQVILIPPSGMSVTSSEFVTSGAGQYTTTYNLETGGGRDIEVRIKTNQIGDFGVQGRAIYYYGGNKSTKEDYTLTLPIRVRPDGTAPTGIQALMQKSIGVALPVVILMVGILYLLKRKLNR